MNHNPAMPQLLYMDNQLLVVSKPFDLPSAPDEKAEEQDCLISRLEADFPGLRAVQPLAPETSGVTLLALTEQSQHALQTQFNDGVAERHYQALLDECAGTEAEGKLEIADGNIHWTRLPAGEDEQRLELRMHPDQDAQLPAMLESAGYTIRGLTTWPEQRLHLHARRLQFQHPVTGQAMLFESPCPF